MPICQSDGSYVTKTNGEITLYHLRGEISTRFLDGIERKRIKMHKPYFSLFLFVWLSSLLPRLISLHIVQEKYPLEPEKVRLAIGTLDRRRKAN